jgi:hypothetical protein
MTVVEFNLSTHVLFKIKSKKSYVTPIRLVTCTSISFDAEVCNLSLCHYVVFVCGVWTQISLSRTLSSLECEHGFDTSPSLTYSAFPNWSLRIKKHSTPNLYRTKCYSCQSSTDFRSFSCLCSQPPEGSGNSCLIRIPPLQNCLSRTSESALASLHWLVGVHNHTT